MWKQWCIRCFKGTINVTKPDTDTHAKKLAFKNNVLFISCVSKINNVLTDNAEHLDSVMPANNLSEYRKDY